MNGKPSAELGTDLATGSIDAGRNEEATGRLLGRPNFLGGSSQLPRLFLEVLGADVLYDGRHASCHASNLRSCGLEARRNRQAKPNAR